MQLPNAGNVVVEPAKLRDYLLSRFHYSGRFKAAFFEALGYAREDWQRLADRMDCPYKDSPRFVTAYPGVDV